jgi:hypothetical protein
MTLFLGQGWYHRTHDTCSQILALTLGGRSVHFAHWGWGTSHEAGTLLMTSLIVRCPKTGRELSTGIETDGVDRLPKVGTRMRCPLCGGEHFWTSKEVWFAESARELHQPRS